MRRAGRGAAARQRGEHGVPIDGRAGSASPERHRSGGQRVSCLPAQLAPLRRSGPATLYPTVTAQLAAKSRSGAVVEPRWQLHLRQQHRVLKLGRSDGDALAVDPAGDHLRARLRRLSARLQLCCGRDDSGTSSDGRAGLSLRLAAVADRAGAGAQVQHPHRRADGADRDHPAGDLFMVAWGMAFHVVLFEGRGRGRRPVPVGAWCAATGGAWSG